MTIVAGNLKDLKCRGFVNGEWLIVNCYRRYFHFLDDDVANQEK